MANNDRTLPEGAGATHSGAGATRPAGSTVSSASRSQDYSAHGSRDLVVAERGDSRPETATIVGAALAGAVIGAALPFMLGRRSEVASGGSSKQSALVTESILIDRPARTLYDFWRDFTNLSRFMDNIKSVEKLDDKRSHWVIKAPAGTSVEFDSRVVEDVPGRVIAWESEEGASVPNRGRVEFVESGSGSATNVTTTISYDPPAGAAGRLVAKLFQREPSVQAREDLARFKRLMETGSAD